MQNDEDNRLLSHDDCEILPWLRSGIISVPCESAPDLNFAKERCNNFIDTFKGVKQEPNYEIKSLIIEEDTCKNLQMSFFFAYGFLGLSALVLLSFIVVQIVQSAMRMKGKNTTVIDEFEDDEVPAPPPPLDLSVTFSAGRQSADAHDCEDHSSPASDEFLPARVPMATRHA